MEIRGEQISIFSDPPSLAHRKLPIQMASRENRPDAVRLTDELANFGADYFAAFTLRMRTAF